MSFTPSCTLHQGRAYQPQLIFLDPFQFLRNERIFLLWMRAAITMGGIATGALERGSLEGVRGRKRNLIMPSSGFETSPTFERLPEGGWVVVKLVATSGLRGSGDPRWHESR